MRKDEAEVSQLGQGSGPLFGCSRFHDHFTGRGNVLSHRAQPQRLNEPARPKKAPSPNPFAARANHHGGGGTVEPRKKVQQPQSFSGGSIEAHQCTKSTSGLEDNYRQVNLPKILAHNLAPFESRPSNVARKRDRKRPGGGLSGAGSNFTTVPPAKIITIEEI